MTIHPTFRAAARAETTAPSGFGGFVHLLSAGRSDEGESVPFSKLAGADVLRARHGAAAANFVLIGPEEEGAFRLGQISEFEMIFVIGGSLPRIRDLKEQLKRLPQGMRVGPDADFVPIHPDHPAASSYNARMRRDLSRHRAPVPEE